MQNGKPDNLTVHYGYNCLSFIIDYLHLLEKMIDRFGMQSLCIPNFISNFSDGISDTVLTNDDSILIAHHKSGLYNGICNLSIDRISGDINRGTYVKGYHTGLFIKDNEQVIDMTFRDGLPNINKIHRNEWCQLYDVKLSIYVSCVKNTLNNLNHSNR